MPGSISPTNASRDPQLGHGGCEGPFSETSPSPAFSCSWSRSGPSQWTWSLLCPGAWPGHHSPPGRKGALLSAGLRGTGCWPACVHTVPPHREETFRQQVLQQDCAEEAKMPPPDSPLGVRAQSRPRGTITHGQRVGSKRSISQNQQAPPQNLTSWSYSAGRPTPPHGHSFFLITHIHTLPPLCMCTTTVHSSLGPAPASGQASNTHNPALPVCR